MLIPFKSAASGDVMMFEEIGKELPGVLGKDPDADKGIVTVEQLSSAIAALRAAIDGNRSTKREQPEADEADEADDRQPDDNDKPTRADRADQLASRIPLRDCLTTAGCTGSLHPVLSSKTTP